MLSFRGYHGEKYGFGTGIVVHGFMKVQVVFRQIGEYGRVKFTACNTPHDQGMGGYFHAYMGHALTDHALQHFLQIHHVGRCVVRRKTSSSISICTVPITPVLYALFPQNMGGDMSRCCFSVGSCHCNHPHFP